MIGRVAALFHAIPQGLAIKAALILLVFGIGYASGNGHATQRALDRERQIAADTQREVSKQLILWKQKSDERLGAEMAQRESADKQAFAVMSKGRADTETARRLAERRLSALSADNLKLTETTDGLKAVNEMLAAELRPNDPGCVLSPGVRRALDFASGAAPDPASGDTEATAPGVPAGSGTTAPALTCDELARGYVNLSEHDRMMVAWVLSWQTWAKEVLR